MEIVESDNAGSGPPPSVAPGRPERGPPQGGGGGGGYYGGHGDGGGRGGHGGGGGGDGRLSETIKVPIDAVGMIIGKGKKRTDFIQQACVKLTSLAISRWRDNQRNAVFNWLQNQRLLSIQPKRP